MTDPYTVAVTQRIYDASVETGRPSAEARAIADELGPILADVGAIPQPPWPLEDPCEAERL